jgi:hypothetical protein
MLRLPSGPLSARWSEFLHALLRDLQPLGYVVDTTDHAISVSTTLPTTPEEIERFWDAAHQRRHLGLLADYAETIRTFEARHPDVFVDMDLFQPSAIQPTLQIVDFTNSRDSDISETRAWVGKGCRDLDLRCNLWLIPGK